MHLCIIYLKKERESVSKVLILFDMTEENISAEKMPGRLLSSFLIISRYLQLAIHSLIQETIKKTLLRLCNLLAEKDRKRERIKEGWNKQRLSNSYLFLFFFFVWMRLHDRRWLSMRRQAASCYTNFHASSLRSTATGLMIFVVSR